MTHIDSFARLFDLVDAPGSEFPAIANAVACAKAAIGKRSAYYHPNGFIAFNLHSFSDGRALRLHVWSPRHPCGGPRGFEIHDHVYSLNSAVICGAITQTTYLREADAPIYKVYSGAYEGEYSVLTMTNDLAALSAVAPITFRIGEKYSLPAGSIHAVAPSRELSATIVATRRSSAHFAPLIFSQEGEAEPVRFLRRNLEMRTQAALLEELFGRMAAAKDRS